jgi:hypothetical protein
MHEFMMYSLGVPLSKSYMTNFFATIQGIANWIADEGNVAN